MRRQAVRGSALTLGTQALNFTLGLGSTAILARILDPEAFGLIAMTAVITGFVGIFRDSGLSSATIQRREVTDAQLSGLFWINMLLGVLAAGATCALAPAVALFYGDPRLTGVTAALSVSFLFSGPTVQHKAMLRRRMRFRALAAAEITGLLSGNASAIILALAGAGYWSLIALPLGQAVGQLAAVVAADPWRPARPRRAEGLREMLGFGGDIILFRVVNYFSRSGDNLLIGWQLGAPALAFYDKAYRMLLLPVRQLNGPMGSVLLPVLSRLNEEPARFSRFFLRGLELLSGITLFVITGLAVFSEEVVRVWLGPGWEESAILFRLLAVAAAAGAVTNCSGWLMISMGRTARYRNVGVVTSILNFGGFALGLPFGVEGVATAYSVTSALLFVPVWMWILKGGPVTPAAFFKAVVPGFVAAAAAAGGALLVKSLLAGSLHPAAAFALAAATYAAIYAGLLLFAFGRLELYRTTLGELRREKTPAAGAADSTA